MSLKSAELNHGAVPHPREEGARAVTVPTAMAQRTRQMNPDIRTAHPNPTRANSFWSMIGNTVPPITVTDQLRTLGKIRSVLTNSRARNRNSDRGCAVFTEMRRNGSERWVEANCMALFLA